MTKLDALYLEGGQSPWVDNIRRDWLNNGTLAELVDSGVRGVTSNPAIFAKALASTSDYDSRISSLSGTDVEELFEVLAVEDVRDACDVLMPIHTASVREFESGVHRYVDGFVSLEVSPRLARSCEETVVAARRLAESVGRPNLMVKIPATAECLPAIRRVLSEGINVNVTLIFSLERYAEVIDTFILGANDALSAGRDISNIASVASFFVSRVDASIDPMLGPNSPYLGTAAIGQVAKAYDIFLRRFGQSDARLILEAGGQVQRPLWASTSPKNPEYDSLIYVETLVAPETVNTLPDATLNEFLKSGDSSVPSIADAGYRDSAIENFDAIAHLVDVKAVTTALERNGVAAFVSAYAELLETVSKKVPQRD